MARCPTIGDRYSNCLSPRCHCETVSRAVRRGFLNARILVATAAAMVAFAANSLLCRAALGDGHIDAASFSSLRVMAGALTLGLILLFRGKGRAVRRADWRTVLSLYAYIVFFSFAYLSLDAGTGALILFGAVQLTMFAVALRQGERVTATAWLGYLLAAGGLIYLVSPGVTAPAPLGALLMACLLYTSDAADDYLTV